MVSMKHYARLLLALGAAHVIFFTSLLQGMSNADFRLEKKQEIIQAPSPFLQMDDDQSATGAAISAIDPSLRSMKLVGETNHKRTIDMKKDYEVAKIKIENREEMLRLSPENTALAEGIQISDGMKVVVGGYTDNYRGVARTIQFFNIKSQEWTKEVIELPDMAAETHQGIAFDTTSSMLYIISGQKGAGCMPATTFCTRLNLDTKRFETLPALPSPRFAPSVAIVADPVDPSIKHIHVFGGASESRNLTATDHWRLQVNGDILDSDNIEWEALEPVPDAGTHGASFVCEKGYIYYTGFCSMDPGAIPSPSMTERHQHAAQHAKQLLHHVSDAGFTFRYPSAYAQATARGQPHWERLSDMPFPVCHAGSAVNNGRLYLVGGDTSTRQTSQGSAPSSLSVIQTYDSTMDVWQVSSFSAGKRTKLFLTSAWIDHEREKLFSLHPGNSLVTADLVDGGGIARKTG
jgi:hypothetical protein